MLPEARLRQNALFELLNGPIWNVLFKKIVRTKFPVPAASSNLLDFTRTNFLPFGDLKKWVWSESANLPGEMHRDRSIRWVCIELSLWRSNDSESIISIFFVCSLGRGKY